MGWRSIHSGDGHIDLRIIYGRVADPGRALEDLGSAVPSSPLGAHYAIIAEGTPGFRLSTPGWANLTTRNLALATSPALLYELVREKLIAKLPTFSVRLHLFVERYLEDAKRHVPKQPGSEPEIFSPEDWVYSAFLPLPEARVELPGDASGTRQFAELRVLFWTGESAIGVQLEPQSSVVGSKKKNLEALSAAWPELTLIWVPRDRLSKENESFPTDLLPIVLTNFWKEMRIPQGPSLSEVLEQPFTEQADH